MNFSIDILNIPNGATVQIFELERQECIYKEYIKLGKESDYDRQRGLYQVLR